MWWHFISIFNFKFWFSKFLWDSQAYILNLLTTWVHYLEETPGFCHPSEIIFPVTSPLPPKKSNSFVTFKPRTPNNYNQKISEAPESSRNLALQSGVSFKHQSFIATLCDNPDNPGWREHFNPAEQGNPSLWRNFDLINPFVLTELMLTLVITEAITDYLKAV